MQRVAVATAWHGTQRRDFDQQVFRSATHMYIILLHFSPEIPMAYELNTISYHFVDFLGLPTRQIVPLDNFA